MNTTFLRQCCLVLFVLISIAEPCPTAWGDTPAGSEGWKQAANWSKVANGMTKEQVREVLGPPTRQVEGMIEQWIYGNLENLQAGTDGVKLAGIVAFQDQKVVTSSFFDLSTIEQGTTPAPTISSTPAPAPAPVPAPVPVPDAPVVPPTPNGFPGWFVETHWHQITFQSTEAEVLAWLGEPTRRLSVNEWEYVLPGLNLNSPVGKVTFEAKTKRVSTVSHDREDIALLELVARAWTPGSPKWMSPGAWATVRATTDWTGKTGRPMATIESLMGPPTEEIDEFGQFAWRYSAPMPGSDPVQAGFPFDDFKESKNYYAPDWKKVLAYLETQTRIAETGPLWTNPEAWRRLAWRLDAGRQHNWAEYERDESDHDISKLSTNLRLGDAALVSAYIGTPSNVAWSQSPAPFGPPEWDAEVTYPNGTVLVIGTGETGPVAPSNPARPWLKRIKSPPVPVALNLPKRHPAWTDDQWKQIQGDALGASAVKLNDLTGTLDRLLMSMDVALASSLGSPDSIDVQFQPLVGIENPKWCRVTAHYGSGTLVWLTLASDQEIAEIKGDPGKLTDLSPIGLVEVNPPADVLAAGSTRWPTYATPAADDLDRWKLIGPGDSLRWVRYLLGDPAKSSSQRWEYGPWVEKRLHTGTVFIEDELLVGATQVPAP